jgi:hypothetical protein
MRCHAADAVGLAFVQPSRHFGRLGSPSRLVPDVVDGRTLMRRPRYSAEPIFCKITLIVPEDCAEGLRQFALELRRRREARTISRAGEWRRLSRSADLLLDPERGARCAVRDTGAIGRDRYLWTVAVLGEDLPVSSGRVSDRMEARTAAETALFAVTGSARAEL